MNADTFNKHLAYMQKATVDTLAAKAKEYADDADRLHNFKIAGPLQSRTPIGALGGFMAKHTISVYDMIIGTDKGFEFPLEMWEEKIKDHINYLFLLWGLVNEQDEVAEALKAAATVLQEKVDAQRAAAVPSGEFRISPDIEEALMPKPEMMTVDPKFEAIIADIDAGLKKKAPAEADETGVAEDAKLRRKTRKALLFWCEKHGNANLSPIIRKTTGKSYVTEATLRRMLQGEENGETRHWEAVEKALKKLALEDIKAETAEANQEAAGI